MPKSKSKSKAKAKVKASNHKPSSNLLISSVCARCKGTGKFMLPDRIAMRRLRKSKGLSVRAMAKRLKVSAPFVSDVELGRRGGPAHVLQAYQKL